MGKACTLFGGSRISKLHRQGSIFIHEKYRFLKGWELKVKDWNPTHHRITN